MVFASLTSKSPAAVSALLMGSVFGVAVAASVFSWIKNTRAEVCTPCAGSIAQNDLWYPTFQWLGALRQPLPEAAS